MLVKKVTYFGEFGYLNSSCIRKGFIATFCSSSSDTFTPLLQNSVTDVSALVSGRHVGSIWMDTSIASLHIWPVKKSPHTRLKKHCDLNLSESLCISAFFLFLNVGLYL